MPTANADLAALVAELTAVADRGIDRCWESKGRRQPVKMPRLLQAVRKVNPELPEPEALEQTLRAAIRQLGDERYGPGHPTWAWIAEVTFRFVEIPLPEQGGQVYANIQRALAVKLGVSGNSKNYSRWVSAPLRQKLAAAILSLAANPSLAHQDEPSSADIDAASDVARPELERQLEEASTATPTGIITLWGESGNGKSHLARKVAERRWGADQVAFLQGPAQANSLFDVGLSEVLQGAGMEVHGWSWAAKIRALKRIIQTGTRYSAVIVDDIDEATARLLVGNTSATPVILISPVRFNDLPCVSILVNAYEPAEAKLAMGVSAQDNSAQVEELCRLVGYRPAAIAIARGLVERRLISLTELLEACRHEPGSLLDAVSDLVVSTTRRPLISVYREMYERTADNRIAHSLLLGLVWITKSQPEILVSAVAGEIANTAPEDIRIKAAIAKLESVGLIHRQGETLHINELSVDILRTITAPRLQDLLRTIYDQADAYNRWWSGQDRTKPNGTVRTIAFLHGQLLNYAQLRAKSFYPQLNFGVFNLTSSAMLVWQDGVEMFSEARGLQLALIDSTFDNGKLYVPGGQITELLERNPSAPMARERLILFALMVLEPISHSPSGTRLPSGAAAALEGDNVVKIDGKSQSLSLVNGSPSKFKHALIAPDQLLNLSKQLNIPMWAVCGGLYDHADFDVGEPRCPGCAEGIDVEPSLNSRATEIGMTMRLLEYVGDYARNEMVFHVNAAAMTTWLLQDNEELVLEAGNRCVAALKDWLGVVD